MSYNYIVGIDQSFSNTGIVVLDISKMEIARIERVKAKAIKPDFDIMQDYFTSEANRVDVVLRGILDVVSDYPKEEVLFCVEHLASGSTNSRVKSKDTDYILSFLFFSIMDGLGKAGYNRIAIPPTTHKKAFFPVATGEKKMLYLKYWDTCFPNTGFTTNLEFLDLDQKDAFCLAYMGYLRQKYTMNEIFAYRTIKSRAVGEGRVLETVKGQLCFEDKKAKLCWRCPIFLSCKDKKRFKMPKTNKEKLKFKELQDNCYDRKL